MKKLRMSGAMFLVCALSVPLHAQDQEKARERGEKALGEAAREIAPVARRLVGGQDGYDWLEECRLACTPRCFGWVDALRDKIALFEKDCGNDAARAECIQAAAKKQMGDSQTERLCKNARRGTASCIDACLRKQVGDSQTESLCAEATLYTGDCIDAALRKQMGDSQTERVCKNAARGTAACIDAAREKQMGDEATVRICGPSEGPRPNPNR